MIERRLVDGKVVWVYVQNPGYIPERRVMELRRAWERSQASLWYRSEHVAALDRIDGRRNAR